VIASHLGALGVARTARTWLETKIKQLETPHLEAAKAASAQYRVALTQARAAEEQANIEARRIYLELSEARHAALLAGVEAPGIELPDGWTVQQRNAVEIVDASEVPRTLCIPDTKAVAAALKAGPVPGATLIINPVFVRAKK
jgi:hypothetical protein